MFWEIYPEPPIPSVAEEFFVAREKIMAIEELTETALFRRVRIPLSDFIHFPRAVTNRDGIKRPIVLESPTVHFRCRPGFYLCTEFSRKFYAHLRPRPEAPTEASLFVWTLKRECNWASAQHGFEGKNQPVPWWVIRPFLAYEETGNVGNIISSRYPVPFFMDAKGSDDAYFKEPTSLELHYGALRAEWWLDLMHPEPKHTCYEGQTFLSVA